jgi:Protein of unknown function (DUF2971)
MKPRSIPRKLYKYRPFNVYCLRLLTHAEVIYSNPRCFNDPLDCDPTIHVDIDRSEMERLCYSFLRQKKSDVEARAELTNYRYLSSEDGDFRTQPDVDDYLKQMLAQRVKVELDLEFSSKGVLSLSERWDSPLMWSHYADNHRGLCIEFDTTELPHPNLRPINYRAPRSIRASSLFQWKVQASVEAEKRVFDTYFLAKAGPWRYEKEWREISLANGVTESGLRVTAIHFGLQCDGAVIQSVVKLLGTNPEVSLFDLYPRDDSFRLRRVPVDRNEIGSYGLRTPAAIEFKDVFLPEERDGADESA